MTIAEMIAVLRAAKEGKDIEVRTYHGKWEKRIRNDSDFNFNVFEYRVAPEPRDLREWWVLKPTGSMVCYFYDTKEDALRALDCIVLGRGEVIHVAEVATVCRLTTTEDV